MRTRDLKRFYGHDFDINFGFTICLCIINELVLMTQAARSDRLEIEVSLLMRLCVLMDAAFY